MGSVPRAQAVLAEQVGNRPERYEGYPKDLIEILNESLRSISDKTEKTRRRRDLAEAIKAKASQIPVSENNS